MVLNELAAYLQAQGHGTMGRSIFQSQLPHTPHAAIALFETGGLAPEYHAESTTAATERPTVQIVVRDSSYGPARVRMEAVLRDLEAINGDVLSGVAYRRVVALQSPYGRPLDDAERPSVGVNILVEKDISLS